MKKPYEEPEIEIIKYDVKSVILRESGTPESGASGGYVDDGEDGPVV